MKAMTRLIAAALAGCFFVVSTEIAAADPIFLQGPFGFCPRNISPTYHFGFKALYEAIGVDTMGAPLECEHGAASGDTLQKTTQGLAFYRQRTNTPTFTDGYTHWALTTGGVVSWVGASIEPPVGGLFPAPEPSPPASITARQSTDLPPPSRAIRVCQGSGICALTDDAPPPRLCSGQGLCPLGDAPGPVVISDSGAVVDSYIRGDFNGWIGDTVFALDNGQVWQQQDGSYRYEYLYHPHVLIYPAGSGHRATIVGRDYSVLVQRLR